MASLVAQTVKNPPAMWGTWVRSLGREDPLEEEMATHSSIPAWRIPWTEEPGGLHNWQETATGGKEGKGIKFPNLLCYKSPDKPSKQRLPSLFTEDSDLISLG